MDWLKFVEALSARERVDLEVALRLQRESNLTFSEMELIVRGRRIDASKSVMSRLGVSPREALAIVNAFNGSRQ